MEYAHQILEKGYTREPCKLPNYIMKISFPSQKKGGRKYWKPVSTTKNYEYLNTIGRVIIDDGPCCTDCSNMSGAHFYTLVRPSVVMPKTK